MMSRSLLALLVVVVSAALAVATPHDKPRLQARRPPTPGLPFDPDTTVWCTWWYDNHDGSTSCEAMPGAWGITEEEFKRWSCDAFVTGRSYCVDAWGEPEPPKSSTSSTSSSSSTSIATPPPSSVPSEPPTTTTTPPSNGIETPQPIQPGMVDNCDSFHLVVRGDSCDVISRQYGLTVSQFLEWNPEVGGMACGGIWLDAYVCVSIIGHDATPSPTEPGNGITTPTPIQPGMVDNCDAFHFVAQGETCATIASRNGITVAQFTQWNSAAGPQCTGLWAGTYACVSIIGHTPTTPPPGNGIETPSPIQDGMTRNCRQFHLVAPGQTCAVIVARYSITLASFLQWNPAAGRNCEGLWANTYACVAVL